MFSFFRFFDFLYFSCAIHEFIKWNLYCARRTQIFKRSAGETERSGMNERQVSNLSNFDLWIFALISLRAHSAVQFERFDLWCENNVFVGSRFEPMDDAADRKILK